MMPSRSGVITADEKLIMKWMLLIGLQAPCVCLALEYSLDQQLDIITSHYQNVSMEVENPISVFGTTFNPQLNAGIRAETWSGGINADLKFSTFNRSGYGSEDQLISLSSGKQGERYRLGLNMRAAHDTTRTSEEDSSGRFSNERRKHYSLSPSFSYIIDEKNTVTLAYSASKVDYVDEDYTGSLYGNVSAQIRHNYSERMSLFLQLNQSDYESDDQTGNFLFSHLFFGNSLVDQTYVTASESTDARIGLSVSVLEGLSIYAVGGVSETDTRYDIDDADNLCSGTSGDSNWLSRGLCDIGPSDNLTKVAELEISWPLENQSVGLNYKNEARPSSEGYLQRTESVELDWKYQFDQKNTVKINSSWKQFSDDSGADLRFGSRNNDRVYYYFSFGYSYRLSEQWYLSANYKYRNQKRESSSSAIGSQGSVTIRYRPGMRKW